MQLRSQNIGSNGFTGKILKTKDLREAFPSGTERSWIAEPAFMDASLSF